MFCSFFEVHFYADDQLAFDEGITISYQSETILNNLCSDSISLNHGRYFARNCLTIGNDTKVRIGTYGSDFVFDEDYELIPIETVSQFVAENKHLPGIMPANKMMDEGVNIAEMQVKLLQKIEELTLYIIIQQKEIERLNTLFIGNE